MEDTKVFKLEVRCDNDAFTDGASIELARMLRDVASRIENQSDDSLWCYQSIKDTNGNSVGEFCLKPRSYWDR